MALQTYVLIGLGILPFILAYIFYLLNFSHTSINQSIKVALDSSKNHEIMDYIDAKKYEFTTVETLLLVGMAALVLLFVVSLPFTAVLGVNFYSNLFYFLTAYIFIFLLLVYLGMSKMHSRIIINLYLKKK